MKTAEEIDSLRFFLNPWICPLCQTLSWHTGGKTLKTAGCERLSFIVRKTFEDRKSCHRSDPAGSADAPDETGSSSPCWMRHPDFQHQGDALEATEAFFEVLLTQNRVRRIPLKKRAGARFFNG